MIEVNALDFVLSVGVGLSIGWFVGGLWNLMQGRKWSGRIK